MEECFGAHSTQAKTKQEWLRTGLIFSITLGQQIFQNTIVWQIFLEFSQCKTTANLQGHIWVNIRPQIIDKRLGMANQNYVY